MYKVYSVKEGDTLDAIASNWNTDVTTLREINNFPMMYQPRLGEQIVVPAMNTTMQDM